MAWGEGSCGFDGGAIEVGTRADYVGLARFHYRAGLPATFAKVLRARMDGGVVGVLVVSMPTLNARWRDLAWPSRYSSGPMRARAQRINDELRTISRVVVDPRYRGLGVARSLVRAYLDAPLTPATESMAMMGGVCPFLSKAGMTTYRLGPSRRDVRLRADLRGCGVEAWMLADCDRAAALLSHRDDIRTAVRRWAMGSKATRGVLSRAGVVPMLAVLASSATVSMRVCAHALCGSRVPPPACPETGLSRGVGDGGEVGSIERAGG